MFLMMDLRSASFTSAHSGEKYTFKYTFKTLPKFSIHPAINDRAVTAVAICKKHYNQIYKFDVKEVINLWEDILNYTEDVHREVIDGE